MEEPDWDGVLHGLQGPIAEADPMHTRAAQIEISGVRNSGLTPSVHSAHGSLGMSVGSAHPADLRFLISSSILLLRANPCLLRTPTPNAIEQQII